MIFFFKFLQHQARWSFQHETCYSVRPQPRFVLTHTLSNDFYPTHFNIFLKLCWLPFCSSRCWWQQSELDLLRAPDTLSAAQPVWRPAARPLGQLHHGRLLHPRLRLPQCPGSHHRDWQRPGHLPAEGSRVQRSADGAWWTLTMFAAPRMTSVSIA